jgi:hypothetical protein
MLWLKLGFLVALVAGVFFLKHGYDEGKRDEGRAEVHKLWDAAVAAQKTREAEAAKAAEALAAEQDAERAKAFALLAGRNHALEVQLSAARVDQSILVGLRDAVRTANAEGSREPAKDTAAAAGPADGLSFVNWFDNVNLSKGVIMFW